MFRRLGRCPSHAGWLVAMALAAPACAHAAWTSPVDLSAVVGDADQPQVGIDSTGRAFAVWQRSVGSNVRVQLRTRSATGSLGSVYTVSPVGQDASTPQIAVDG